MKIIIISILTILYGTSQSQTNSGELELIFLNCETNKSSTPKDAYLTSVDSSFVLKIEDSFDIYNYKTINEGKYNLTYINIFGQKMNKEIEVKANISSLYAVCVEKVKEYKPENLIEKLEDDFRLEILFSSVGCFHSNNETLTINSKNGNIKAKFIRGSTQIIAKNILPIQLSYLQTFEKELRLLNDYKLGCTTVDSYTIRFNGNKIRLVDDTCNWDGYLKLKKMIIAIDEHLR